MRVIADDEGLSLTTVRRIHWLRIPRKWNVVFMKKRQEEHWVRVRD
jgi:hypothetical protein